MANIVYLLMKKTKLENGMILEAGKPIKGSYNSGFH
jgi:hypothetical protein